MTGPFESQAMQILIIKNNGDNTIVNIIAAI